MPANVKILAGAPQSGKTERLIALYRHVLGESTPGSGLWLAPHRRSVSAVRNRLVSPDFSACFCPGIVTFAQCAEAILQAARLPIRPLDRTMKRQLLRQILQELEHDGLIEHFKPILHTGGLVDLIGEFITEVKRLEIWPEDLRAACEKRGITRKDEELLRLYEKYQSALLEHRLFDAEGRFWTARDQLFNKGQRRPYENVRLLVVDGFTDFTRTQHEILQSLATWVPEIIITLPMEPESSRQDLFYKPQKTLLELKRRHPGCTLTFQARPEKTEWPALRHAERFLFSNPREKNTPRDASSIEILPAASPLKEFELIGGRIKKLLLDGKAKAEEIAVVFRSAPDDDSPVMEIFRRQGIPVVTERGLRLERTPLLRFLASLLRLDLEDWPFNAVLQIVESTYFRPAGFEKKETGSATTVERLLRRLLVPRGRNALLEQLAVRSRVEEKSGEETSWETETAASASLALKIFEGLAAALDAMPLKTTLPQWGVAWQNILMTTAGLTGDASSEVTANSSSSPLVPRPSPLPCPADSLDISGWNHLCGILAATDRLASWLGRRPPELDRREALQALLDLLASERQPRNADDCGCVRILSAASVRSLHVPYLFVAGLSEKSFPQSDREDRLYNDAEYVRLIEQGLPLIARTERHREEMLLFYETVTRATKHLSLSYPAWDEKAQPLSPSPFLLELEQAFGDKPPHRLEVYDFRPLPLFDEPFSAVDFRLKAVADALEGNISYLAGYWRWPQTLSATESADDSLRTIPLAVKNLRDALELNLLRQDYEHFTAAEGALSSDEARRYFARHFSTDRTFTATEFESYATCPFRFFLEHILRIRAQDDLSLRIDYAERGQTVHNVLADFHQRVNEAMGVPSSPLELEPDRYDAILARSLEEIFRPASRSSLREALREIDRRTIVGWLQNYRAQLEKYAKESKNFDKAMTPELFEVSFGKMKHRSTTWAIEESLPIDGEKETIRMSGRIDRVDTGIIDGQNVFNILDYKTGSTSKFRMENVQGGTALQLPIYAMAVAELFLLDRDALPWRAGYWNVPEGGFKSHSCLSMYSLCDDRIEPTETWEKIRLQMPDILFSLLHNMRDGCFYVHNNDENCTEHCPFKTVCRINPIRSLEKQFSPGRRKGRGGARNEGRGARDETIQ